MIGLVTGVPEDAGKGVLLILTKGGVGYLVNVSRGVKEKTLKEKEIALHTHTVLNTSGISLYGFCEKIEYTTFLLLLSVSGIGPKGALNILDTTTPQNLLSNIGREDVTELVALGVPKRQAERMVVELKTKINVEGGDASVADAVAALIALGYDRQEIAETLRTTSVIDLDTGEQIKKILRAMQTSR